MVSVAVAPDASVPMFHVGDVYAPWLAVTSPSESAAGKASVTTVPGASDGPLFFTATVNVTVCPGNGLALFTVLVTCKSADDAIGVVAELDADVRSPPPITLAVLMTDAGAL